MATPQDVVSTLGCRLGIDLLCPAYLIRLAISYKNAPYSLTNIGCPILAGYWPYNYIGKQTATVNGSHVSLIHYCGPAGTVCDHLSIRACAQNSPLHCCFI